MTAEATKGERTRKKLIDATGALLRRRGYHATGLSDIVAESGAPRGSLYFHFPGGKDELACEAIRASTAEWRARIEAATRDAPSFGAAIAATAALLADDLEASGWDNGCPVAAVALESPSDVVRATVEAHFASWLDTVEARLTAYGLAPGPARHFASVSLSAFEGALLLARVTRSRAPLDAASQALQALMASLAPAAPPPSPPSSAPAPPSPPASPPLSRSPRATSATRTRTRGSSRRPSPRPR